MTLAEHMARGLYAGWRMLGFRDDGLAFLEPGRAGARRSFAALLLALPLYAFGLWMESHNPVLNAARAPLWVLTVVYAAGWPLVAFVLYHFARLLAREDRYFPFLAAYNWMRIWAIVLTLPLAAVVGFDLVSESTANLVFVATGLYLIGYKSFGVRQTLTGNWFHAIAAVLLDLVVIRILETIVTGLSMAG